MEQVCLSGTHTCGPARPQCLELVEKQLPAIVVLLHAQLTVVLRHPLAGRASGGGLHQ
jgi:hypothetical protein